MRRGLSPYRRVAVDAVYANATARITSGGNRAGNYAEIGAE